MERYSQNDVDEGPDMPSHGPPPHDPAAYVDWDYQRRINHTVAHVRKQALMVARKLGPYAECILTDQNGRKWKVLAEPAGEETSPLGLAGFQLVPASTYRAGADPNKYCIVPSIIDASFHPGGEELAPTVGGMSLNQHPTIIAGGTTDYVYLKCVLTYDENDNLILGEDWSIEVAKQKPQEQRLEVSEDGEVQPGVFYRRLGAAIYTTATGLLLSQTRFGPITASYHQVTGDFLLFSPYFQIGTILATNTLE